MSALTLWLSVYPPEAMMGGGGELLTKTIDTGFLPRPNSDDMIHVLYEPESDEWGVATEVKHVYWNGDGTVHAELVPYQVDPNEQMQKHMGRYRRAWWSDQDGDDLVPRLLASGWQTYEQWKAKK